MALGTSVGAALSEHFRLPLFAQEKAAKAKRCVMIWLMGAPSQIDTLDPKPGTETGGPFGDMETAAKGIRISENLPLLARQMKHMSLIRSVNSKDPNHDTAQYMLHTAYRKAADVEHPHVGSVVANELGETTPDLPMAVVLGAAPPVGGGYLPPDRAPIVFDKIAAPAEDVLASPNNPRERLERRWELLKRAEDRFAKEHDDRKVEERRRAYDKAYQVLTSDRVKAFDVKREPDEMRRLYGDTDFGNAVLMSRRLLEAGTRFVEVMYGDWDTHNDNHNRVKKLCGEVDRPVAALLEDLSKKKMLDETLVVWMGEFGRTPRINAANGRDHWTTWTVGLAGGGIQGGRAVGETDELGLSIQSRPVGVNDLYATIYSCFGIDTEKKLVTVPRPMKILEGGTAVKELF
jgi:hypothetical protein